MNTLGIDATYWIPAISIKAVGYSFVGRYCLEGNYRITLTEADDYLTRDLDIEFFGEHSADFMLGGGPAGTAAGKDGGDYIRSLGAPAGTAIFFTADFDAQPSDIPTLGAFLQAAQLQMGEYRAGIYGGLTASNAFGNTYPVHQTEAWSDGEISPYANFFQRVGTTLPQIPGTSPGAYDEDIAINPTGLWLANPPPPPPPTQKVEEDMWRWMIYGVNGKNVLVDVQNEKPIKTFTDPVGPYGLTTDAARFIGAYSQACTFDVIDPAQFQKAYPGYTV